MTTAERRVFKRGSKRFEVVVISIATIQRRRARLIRRMAARRQLPSSIAIALRMHPADVLAVLSTPPPKGSDDAWR
jgi:hypothetical protein